MAIKEYKVQLKVIMNLVSVFTFAILIFFLGFLGIENMVARLFIILAISWVGFFVFPLVLLSKKLSWVFLRFMKDSPLLFPTIIIVTLIQPIVIGPFNIVRGGIPITAFNYELFVLVFTLITIFATNVHLITKFLLKNRLFRQFIKKLRAQPGTHVPLFSEGIDEKISINEIKKLTYLLMMCQVLPIVAVLIIPLFIFQEINPILELQHFFGSLIFISVSLMAVGVIKTFAFGFEQVIICKHSGLT